jgi:uncharacterized membrane protein affecting hemolysin expression
MLPFAHTRQMLILSHVPTISPYKQTRNYSAQTFHYFSVGSILLTDCLYLKKTYKNQSPFVKKNIWRAKEKVQSQHSDIIKTYNLQI